MLLHTLIAGEFQFDPGTNDVSAEPATRDDVTTNGEHDASPAPPANDVAPSSRGTRGANGLRDVGLCAVLLSLLSSCAGGGGDALPAPGPAQQGTQHTASVAFTIVVPGRAQGGAARRPRYVSVSTKSASITVAPPGGAASAPVVVNCTSVCSGQIAAPAGSDTFAVKLYDAVSGTGNLLSTGTLTQTIVLDAANTVNVTFDGVVKTVSVALAPGSVTSGTAATVTVNFAARDADGNTIVGPGGYADITGAPVTVTLTSSDPTNAKLSATTFTAPPVSAPTLSYTGAAIGNVTVTASASSGATAKATLSIGCAAGQELYADNLQTSGTSSIDAFPIAATGNEAPTRSIQVSSFPEGLAVDATGALYALLRGYGTWNVAVYAPCAAGAATPIRTFTDSNAALQSAIAEAIALGSSGSVAVALADLAPPPSDTLDVFAPGASGTIAPAQTISGSATGLSFPTGVAFDTSARVYAANSDGNTVTAYAAGATGNAAPLHTITGDLTGALNTPNGVTWNGAGTLYVTNCGVTSAQFPASGLGGPGGVDSVTIYTPGANGYPVPARIITGSATALNAPADIAVGATGTIYVLNLGAVSPVVTIYAASANGNAAPIRTIAGASAFPTGDIATSIAVDAGGNLYVPEGLNGVAIFGPGANGNVAPTASLSGTNVGDVDRVRLGPTGKIYTAQTGQPASPVNIYAAGSTGNAAPIATVDLPPVSLEDIETDAAGDLWVSEGTGYTSGAPANPLSVSQIVEFAPGASGAATPIRTLVTPYLEGTFALDPTAGLALTDLFAPFEVDVFSATASGNATPVRTIRAVTNGPYIPDSVGFDAAGNLYVSSLGDGTVKVYASGASGNATPIRAIEQLPTFRATGVDAAGNVYVAIDNDDPTSAVLVYAAGANGVSTPLRTLSGTATGIVLPTAVTTGP